MRRDTKVTVLADAVVASYEWAGFSPAQLLQGPVEITDLSWQAPPLHAECMLNGQPLATYLDAPIAVDLGQLHKFYSEGLYYLRNSPEEIASVHGFKRTTKVLPRASAGERNLIFPLPEFWPEGGPTTGQAFAMDAAWLCMTSVSETTELVSDDNNYYAVTPKGVIGVVDGRPSLYANIWDIDCSGMVQSMLTMPRGLASVGCHYDLIDRMRSILHKEMDRFTDFEGTDWGLQALRILADGETCKPLLTSVQGMAVRVFKRNARDTALKEAIAVMEDWHYTDRTKIAMLFDILVPDHFTLKQFCVKIIDVESVLPSVLKTQKEALILRNLNDYRAKNARGA